MTLGRGPSLPYSCKPSGGKKAPFGTLCALNPPECLQDACGMSAYQWWDANIDKGEASDRKKIDLVVRILS